jgi:HD superfamily phosphohydrolase
VTGAGSDRVPAVACTSEARARPRHDVAAPDDFFVDNGLDFRRVLSQLISSELDVDRLDYLGRDSYFSGARYGQVDVNWILSSLEWYVDSARQGPGAPDVSLALDHRAIYSFDDFMIARYHMFVMVYFHHKSVIFDEMLAQYLGSPECSYSIPSDIEAYCEFTDAHLYAHHVIKGRWEEGEKVIKTSPKYAHFYACDVLKQRWEEAEEIIMTEAKPSYNYARDVIKGRWEEAEDIIKTEPFFWHLYQEEFIK